MKLNIFRKFFATGFLLFTLFFISGLFQGCEQDNLFDNVYSDFDFLELAVDADIRTMSVSDMEIFSEAIGRLDVSKKNGLYRIKQKSGLQVNISDGLFGYIKSMFDNTNEIIKQKSSSSGFSIPRLKSGQTEQTTSSSDCLTHAIEHAGGGSYGDVGSYLISQYGLGVPRGSFYDACSHFFPFGDTVSVGAIPAGPVGDMIISYMVNDTTDHAVNGYWYNSSDGFFTGIDYQNDPNGKPVYIEVAKIVDIFQVGE